jgi:hypothetical protein
MIACLLSENETEDRQVVIALLTGAASLLNYFWWANNELSAELRIVSIAAQAVLTLLTVIAAVRYRGKRLRKSYDGAGYKIFTVTFAVVIMSVLGNIAVLAVLSLRMAGVIKSL